MGMIDKESLVTSLYDLGAVQFGDFTLPRKRSQCARIKPLLRETAGKLAEKLLGIDTEEILQGIDV